MKPLSQALANLVRFSRNESERAQEDESLNRVKRMARDQAPSLSFRKALEDGFGLIAEIKAKSPSQGWMPPKNVEEAAPAYHASELVKAVSVLTTGSFGCSIKSLREVRKKTSKPLLRKDFIVEEYQVYQAKAYGADAILLMANILEKHEMQRLSDLAFEIGLEVLFETHTEQEVEELPSTAKVVGINCRNFQTNTFWFSRFVRYAGWQHDQSTNTNRFAYVDKLPDHFVKVAESGVTVSNVAKVRESGFNCALIGTSLLTATCGVQASLKAFERALCHHPARARSRVRGSRSIQATAAA